MPPPVTVTSCGVDQFAGVNIKNAVDAVPSEVSLLATGARELRVRASVRAVSLNRRWEGGAELLPSARSGCSRATPRSRSSLPQPSAGYTGQHSLARQQRP